MSQPIYETADYSENTNIDAESRRVSRKIYALSVATDNHHLVTSVEGFFEFADRVESYIAEAEDQSSVGKFEIESNGLDTQP